MNKVTLVKTHEMGGYTVRNGDILNPFTYVKTYYVNERSDKASVDDGCFVPGVYRINPYYIMKDSLSLPSFDLKVEYDYYGQTMVNWATGQVGLGAFQIYAFDSFSQEPPSPDPPVKLALMKAYGRILDRAIGGGEALGELRETLQLLAHPFKSFRDFLWSRNQRNLGLLNNVLNYLKTGRWRGSNGVRTGKDALEAAIAAWMELRYGVRPLVYLVEDIIKQVNAKAKQFDENRIHSARATEFRTDTSTKSVEWAAGPYFSAELKREDEITVRASVQYKQHAEQSLLDAYGLTPRHLPELAWELTRASFAVDWWFSVGDWLAAYRVKPGVTILGNTVGVKVTRTVTGFARYKHSWQPPSGYKTLGNVGTYVCESYDRSINQHLPLTPLVTLHMPDLFETVDSLSLILQPILKSIRR